MLANCFAAAAQCWCETWGYAEGELQIVFIGVKVDVLMCVAAAVYCSNSCMVVICAIVC